MPTYNEVGDAIEGERIVFNCRRIGKHSKLIHNSSSHRSISGKLDNALCVINKKFRHIPESTPKKTG